MLRDGSTLSRHHTALNQGADHPFSGWLLAKALPLCKGPPQLQTKAAQIANSLLDFTQVLLADAHNGSAGARPAASNR